MNFEFCTASKIIFGCGKIEQLGMIVGQLGNKYLIVSGGKSAQKSGILDDIQNRIERSGKAYTNYHGVAGEPGIDTVDKGMKIAIESGCDAVISVGGGSVIDTGKAISALITNGGSLLDYLEGVGKGKQITKDTVPFIAIPTTSGTGTEATKNSVIVSRKHKFKRSIRSEKMIPDVAIVDPELTITLPGKVTAWSGMDALTQLIESYVSAKSKPYTDALAIYALKDAGKWLKKAYIDGECLEARTRMAFASLTSGICLANSGLGAVHGIAAALGACYGINHGLACAILLPHVMQVNLAGDVKKYSDIGVALTGKKYADELSNAKAGIEHITQLMQEMDMPTSIREFGVDTDNIEVDQVMKSASGSSMSGNPVKLNEEQIASLFEKIM